MSYIVDYPPVVSIHAFLLSGAVPSIPDNITAYITFSEFNGASEEFEIPLMDHGTGADIIRNDNVYSAFFAHYRMRNGIYFVRARAFGYVNELHISNTTPFGYDFS